jgi:Uma2 family endonuclease
MTDAKKIITLEEFLAMPEDVRGERSELIGGQLVDHKGNSGLHGSVHASIVMELGSKLRRSHGWQILMGVSVLHHLPQEVHVHDIAGWKQAISSAAMAASIVPVRPDWVCEICDGTDIRDFGPRRLALECESVPHYWVVDIHEKKLCIFERIDGYLVQTREYFREDGAQRISPFDAVEIRVCLLLGDDPED